MPQATPNPKVCPCGSGLVPWWRDDWGGDPTKWVCEQCTHKPTEREARVLALHEGAQLALTHLRLCGDRSESAAECGSRAIPLLEKGLGLDHGKAAEVALSRMKGRL
jgi:hypothetical protein